MKSQVLFLLCGLFFGINAFAADVRILDQKGLTRALKKIPPRTAVSVLVKIIPQSGADPDSLNLKSQTGSGQVLEAVKKGKGEFRFGAVPEGAWIIDAGSALKIQKVTIFK